MDSFECITTKLEIREFSPKEVPAEIKLKILEAARLTGTGLNTQHWRFIVVEDKNNIMRLADDSTSGKWIAGARFAIIVLTNPRYKFHSIDAGRVIQNMELAGWNYGIGSCIFTGIRDEKLRNDFAIPDDLEPTVIVGFGYPSKILAGNRKNRLALNSLVYYEKYGKSSPKIGQK